MASRPNPHRSILALACAAIIALLATSACKQGEGELCQVDSDCQTGLLCVEVTGTCQTDQPDIQQDASPAVDSSPDVDAEVDAEADATVDADVPDAAIDAQGPATE